MEKVSKEFVTWIKAHKKQLLIVGISMTAVIILELKNKKAIKELFKTLENAPNKTSKKLSETITIAQTAVPAIEEATQTRLYTSPKEPFDVSQHVRNLSAGRHHSIEKAAEAAALGIVLLPTQTLVDSYTKGAA